MRGIRIRARGHVHGQPVLCARIQDAAEPVLSATPAGILEIVLPSAVARRANRHGECIVGGAAQRMFEPEMPLRRKTHFHCAFNTRLMVQPPARKYSSFVFPKIEAFSVHPASTRGTFRPIVAIREVGMRWPRLLRKTSAAAADGQVVWSWHPDADAKVVVAQ
jgi:hypothetical protein